MKKITIATRKSPLALWQANHVRNQLLESYPDLDIALLTMTTQGDRILDSPLAKMGGKGLFVKELEHALLTNKADIAVHSMKDVPMHLPDGLMLGPILMREDPRDAFVSNHFSSLSELPDHAIIGSSSLRRICQIKKIRPSVTIKNLRGNIHTRLNKLDEGLYDAIILASAGLKRMSMHERITAYLPKAQCLPACGQGALGIELRQNDTATRDLVMSLNHKPSATCVLAERAMNTRLDGGCQVPIAGFAEIIDDKIHMEARVASPDGKAFLVVADTESVTAPEVLGSKLADALLSMGAADILSAIKMVP